MVSEETEAKGIILDQREKIKLMKMSKGYQWEISILPLSFQIMPTDLARLEEIDKILQTKYGSGVDLS